MTFPGPRKIDLHENKDLSIKYYKAFVYVLLSFSKDVKLFHCS